MGTSLRRIIDKDENDPHEIMKHPQYYNYRSSIFTRAKKTTSKKKKHHHVQRRLRQKQEKILVRETHDAELRQLNILAVSGVHYVEYSVGKPSQKVRLALSLNSDYTVFPCSQYNCPNNNCGVPVFNRYQSDSFVQLGCEACSVGGICTNGRCETEEDEWTAYLARDYILTEFGSFDMKFGCQTASNGFLDTIETTSNGILGLSGASTSFINQMYRADVISTTTFSLCFERYNGLSLTNAGTFTIGGYEADFLTSPMVYLQNTEKEGKYTCEITNMYLRDGGGESVTPYASNQKVARLVFDKTAANFRAGTVIDTTYPGTLLNFAIGNSFKIEWSKMTGRTFTTEPIALTPIELLGLPTILVQIKASSSINQFTDPNKVVGMVGTELDPLSPYDVLVAIPANHYMHRQKNGLYKAMLSLDHGNGSILGSNAFQGRHLLFRTGYSSTNTYIGIAEVSKCSDTPPESLYNTVSPTQSITQDTSSSPSSSSPRFDSTLNLNEKLAYNHWPLFVGVAIFLTALAVGLTICCMKQKEKKKQETNSANAIPSYQAPSDDGDGSSFISFGLRRHLFSGKPIQELESGHTSAETRSSEEASKPNRRQQTEGAVRVDEELRDPLLNPNFTRPRNSLDRARNNDNFLLDQPIALLRAAQVDSINREPVLTEPVNTFDNSRPDQWTSQGYSQTSQLLVVPNVTRQPFLADKHAETSDDEGDTYFSLKSRKQARRQLQLSSREISPRRSSGRSRRDPTVRKSERRKPRESPSLEAEEVRRQSECSINEQYSDNLRMQTINLGGRSYNTRHPRSQTLALEATHVDKRRIRAQSMGLGANHNKEPRQASRNGFPDLGPRVERSSSRNHPTSKRSTKAATIAKALRRSTIDFARNVPQSGTRHSDRVPKPHCLLDPHISKERKGTVLGSLVNDSSISSNMTNLRHSEHLPNFRDIHDRGTNDRSIHDTSLHDRTRMLDRVIHDRSMHRNRQPPGEFAQRKFSVGMSEISNSDHSKQHSRNPSSRRRSGNSFVSRQSRGKSVGKMDSERHSQYSTRRSDSIGYSQHSSMRSGSVGRSRHSTMSKDSMEHSQHSAKRSDSIGNPQHSAIRKGSMEHSQHSAMTRGSMEHSQHDRGSSDDYSYQHDQHDMDGESMARSTKGRDRRRSSTLMTIKENASKRTFVAEGNDDEGNIPPLTKNKFLEGMTRMRNSSSMDSFDRHEMEIEMKERNIPAAPQYRIMPKGHRSMW